MLSQTVPLMRSKRLSRLGLSDDPVILAMLEYVAARPGMQRHLQAKTYGDSIINTRETLHAALAGQLHRSVDGRGLTPSAVVPDQHGWIQDPPNTTTGRSFVEAVLLRGSLLHTALRASRGHPDASTACDACGRPESLGHILQVCPRSHAARIERHNKVVQLIVRNAKRKGWNCLVEPTIPTRAGVRRPDIVLYKDTGPACVIDAQVVADNADLSVAHHRKCDYYHQPEITDWIHHQTGAGQVIYSSATLSWRGLLSGESAHCLHKTVGLSRNTLALISQATLEMGHRVYRQFKRSTLRTR